MREILFKIIFLFYNYILIAKKTVKIFIPDILYEAKIY